MSDASYNQDWVRADVVSIADRVEDTPVSAAEPVLWGLKRSVWIQIGVITVLFAALFWPNLRRLWDKTNPFYGEANWGHAVCIPFIGLYYLYVNREKLLSAAPSRLEDRRTLGFRVWALLAIVLIAPIVFVLEEADRFFIPVAAAAVSITLLIIPICWGNRSRELIQRLDDASPKWFGVFIMLFGIALFQYAIYPGQNDFLKDFGMVVTLMGTVLALTSWHVMRIAWFPIAFLVCGIPWPGLIYSRVAGPLQQLAANVAVWTLQLTGVEASVGGTKISMVSHDGSWRTLNVAEACAGMRSLMTFISVAAAVAFLSSRPLWQKIIVVLFAIPIAIFCNVMRVSGQGLLDRYVSHQLSENFAHQFVGLIMLIPAFLLILLVGWVLDQIFVEQIDRRHVRMAPKVLTRTLAVASAPPVALPSSAVPRSFASAREATKTTSAKAAAAEGNGAATVRPRSQVEVEPSPAAPSAATAAPAIAPTRAAAPPPARTSPAPARTPPPPVRTAPPPARTPPPARPAPVARTPAAKAPSAAKPPATPYKPGTPPPPTVRLAWRRTSSPRNEDNGNSSSTSETP